MAERTELWDVTGYGVYDNDPPGSFDIAYANPRHTPATQAGTNPFWGVAYEGQGTFQYPTPFAADNRVIPEGTLIYVPHVQRYFEMVDWCQDCRDATDGIKPGGFNARRLDLYVGGDASPTTAKRNAVINAANNITRLTEDSTGPVNIIFDPAPGKPVPNTNTISGISSGASKTFGPAREGGAVTPPPQGPDPGTGSGAAGTVILRLPKIFGWGGEPWVRDDRVVSFQNGDLRVNGTGWPAPQIVVPVVAGRQYRVTTTFQDNTGWLKVTNPANDAELAGVYEVPGPQSLTFTATANEVYIWAGRAGDGSVRVVDLTVTQV